MWRCTRALRLAADPDQGVEVWKAPDNTLVVLFMREDIGDEEVFVPNPADRLPFFVGFVVPFLQRRGALRETPEVERMAEAVIAYARHGEGDHIDAI